MSYIVGVGVGTGVGVGVGVGVGEGGTTTGGIGVGGVGTGGGGRGAHEELSKLLTQGFSGFCDTQAASPALKQYPGIHAGHPEHDATQTYDSPPISW